MRDFFMLDPLAAWNLWGINGPLYSRVSRDTIKRSGKTVCQYVAAGAPVNQLMGIDHGFTIEELVVSGVKPIDLCRPPNSLALANGVGGPALNHWTFSDVFSIRPTLEQLRDLEITWIDFYMYGAKSVTIDDFVKHADCFTMHQWKQFGLKKEFLLAMKPLTEHFVHMGWDRTPLQATWGISTPELMQSGLETTIGLPSRRPEAVPCVFPKQAGQLPTGSWCKME